MKPSFAFRVISTLCVAITATLAVSLSKHGCPEKCGNVTIPYPFGIGSKCSGNFSYTIICQNSTNPPKPFLSSINREVVEISLHGVVIVNQPVLPMNCSDGLKTALPISLEGSSFTVSAHYNTLVVLGCKNSVWLHVNETTVGGCTAFCNANSTDTSCNGVNCCQTTIPSRLQEIEFAYESIHASVNSSSFCGYVFPVDKKWLQNGDYKRYKGLLSDLSNPFDADFRFAPLVLEWEFGNKTKSSNSICKNPDCFRPTYRSMDDIRVSSYYYWNDYGRPNRFSDDYCHKHPHNPQCQSLLDNYEKEFRFIFYYSEYEYVSSSRYCYCTTGYEGNPYIHEGCIDIDECNKSSFNVCKHGETCMNTKGSYSCITHYPNTDGYYNDKSDRFRVIVTKASIVIGIVFGVLILLTAVWRLGKAVRKEIQVIKAMRKYTFFKRNGGLLFEQQMAALENGLEKTKLFSSGELAKATDDYNENRIIGRGGEGIVYKGMLEDGRIVAVKKTERVSQGDIEDFINEVVIVSQINHRNVVKLLGCCLESEVPRLVYEFIPNGTLFHHIHDPHEDFPLFWEMRVRIAKEVAGALAYLHSAASVPIYHRDIKSTNILLDEKYRAKISDFGTSRSLSIDQTHVTTRVVGTFGYIDPEYFQSNHFTEKSDVYSFGVVLVELLTGEKAICAARLEEGRGLAMYFLLSMDENQLFDIVDARVLKEGKREEIEAMAEIARKCLHLNGKTRPTMKEVARHLEGIQVEGEESNFLQNQIESEGCSSADEDDDISSISEINIDLQTIIISHSPDTQHPLDDEP